MKNKTMRRHGYWLAGTAMCALLAGGATAQETTDTADEDTTAVQDTVVIVGSRLATKSAEDFKRNADSVVDSITATDIGVFPDRSIAEALQRVPGVSVIRTSDPTDVTHYTAEPSGVVVRGLTQTRSEFNGRDVFSATSGYGLNYDDVSPALVARVDTFKNQTAEMIEGGIAGTVNIVTSVPFDSAGEVISGSIAANYGDISEQWTPDISGIYSNRWQTEMGEFGLLVSGTHSELVTTSRGAVQARSVIFEPGTYADANGNPIDRELYIPSGLVFTETEYDRVRDGISLAGQWSSPDDKFLLTAQYNRTQYENEWKEHSLENYSKYIGAGPAHTTTYSDAGFIQPQTGTDPFTFQDNGLFGQGVVSTIWGGTGTGWGNGGEIDWNTGDYGVSNTTDLNEANRDPSVAPYLSSVDAVHGFFDDGTPRGQPCLQWFSGGDCLSPVESNTKTRYSQEERTIDDMSLNLKWAPTDNLRFNFDYQHVEAETDLYDIVVGFMTRSDLQIDLTGEYPSLTMVAPTGFNQVGDDPWADARNYRVDNVMDHITESEGTLDAFRADMVYDTHDTPWVDELRVGARVSSREQLHKWGLYNWGAVTPWYADNLSLAQAASLTNGPGNDALGNLNFPGYEPGFYGTHSFGQDILGGGLVGNPNLVFMNFEQLADRDWVRNNFSGNGQIDAGGNAISGWNPICEREGEIEGSCFKPGEIIDVTEDSQAFYAMLNIGGDEANLFGFPLTGNVGLRYVETEVTSGGAINYASEFDASALTCDRLDVTPAGLLDCLVADSLDDQAFSTGDSLSSTVTSKNSYVLPSANFRIELNDKTYLRFAASKAISKPDIGLLKNYATLSRTGISGIDPANTVYDTNGDPVSFIYDYTASASNPRLKPIEAAQYDLSLEHYFEDVGSITGVLFYKDLDEYIQFGTFDVPMTNNGVTRNVAVRGPVNGEGANLLGYELQYRRYFNDILPAPFDGLGIEANYTYVQNQGVTNSNLIADSSGDNALSYATQDGMVQPGRLENLSDHTYNLVGIYEKDKLGVRLAYNWRSEYVISVNECCVGFPVWAESEGFLDASLRYALTDNMELSLQATNLLEEKAVTNAQVRGPIDGAPDTQNVFLPASTFEYDRKFQIGLRAKF